MARHRRHFACLCLLISMMILCVTQGVPATTATALSPRIANYEMDVRLDADQRILKGQQILVWRNTSAYPVNELHFHLYLNGFRNTASTFMQEISETRRNKIREEKNWGFINIDKISDAIGMDITDRLEFIQPDDGNAEDKTVVRVRLLHPVPAYGRTRLFITFTAKLPEPPIARTGAQKEFLMVGQWFPKIGVLENGVWNCHQFHAHSEFYADFGVYKVRLTLPSHYIIGATGLETERIDNPDKTTTHVYVAEDVHDFAWTASPDFVEFTGRSQDVDIRVLMQKDRAGQGLRHLQAAKTAVAFFQDEYGDYPYPNLTVVDPRRGALQAGGMEYPTLITAGTVYAIPAGIRMPEMIILHEFGHNYWYHLVASNEFEEAWLDEGINSFSELQVIEDTFGHTGNLIDFLGIKISDLQVHRSSYMRNPDIDIVAQPSWKYYHGGTYQTMSYSKPALALRTLQNYLGRDVMRQIMRTYFERWKFKHPRGKDFIAIAEEVSGQDLDWFFDQMLNTTAVLDYSVDAIENEEIRKAKGYDFTFSPSGKKIESAAADTLQQSADSLRTKEKSLYSSTVSLRRLGDFIFPVDVEIVFANGDTIREKWGGRSSWIKFNYIRPERVVSAAIDPHNKVPLDIQRSNNSRTADMQRLGMNKWTARLLFWTQFIMDMPQIVNILTAVSAAD